jgi:hypothetical protein
MKTNNKFWGQPIEDLQSLVDEHVFLFKIAWGNGHYDEAAVHSRIIADLTDAIAAHERGGNE